MYITYILGAKIGIYVGFYLEFMYKYKLNIGNDKRSLCGFDSDFV